MKTSFSLIIALSSCILIAQTRKTTIFSVNPNKKTQTTNGINVGVLDAYNQQTINGLNIQINPITLIYPLLPKAIEVPKLENSKVTINGFYISTGGLIDGKKLNGVGLSIYHHAITTNGFSLNFFNNTSGYLNGLHISGVANNSDKGNGINLSLFGNYSDNFNGLHLSLFNEAKIMKGLQLGLSNKSNNLRGIQIGLWNVNEKRKLPIINWNFKGRTKES